MFCLDILQPANKKCYWFRNQEKLYNCQSLQYRKLNKDFVITSNIPNILHFVINTINW